jgi:Rrf2 family protein
MISTKGRYALRAMMYISKKDQLVSIKEISTNENISNKYLEQVVSLLVKSNLLVSVRGSNGGYRLAKNPNNITLFDIFLATEGSLDCNLDEGDVGILRDVYLGLDKKIHEYLKSITLQKLLDEESSYLDYCI